MIGVSGTNGEPVRGLTAADFKVTVGGKPASVQSATPADRPPRVIILVDVSANHDQSSWAATQAMVDGFLAGFTEVGDFTLVTFDDRVQQVIHQTNRASLQGAWGEMFPSGKRESEAGLAEAVKKASVMFGVYRQGDAEFLTTTADQMNKETEQALRQQREAGTRLFGISFDQSAHPAPLPFDLYMKVEDYSPLGAAAKASGGAWMWFDRTRQDATASLRSATAGGKRAGSLVRNYFTLDLQLTNAMTKAEKLKIELIKSSKIDAKDTSAVYPQELFPCQ
ncbi:MAG: vWA domain-containing protein [Terriglobales bacterium]|jgi:hypothetical protein